MPVNQPPIDEDLVKASWYLELTQNVNDNENNITILLASFEELNALITDLQDRVAALENE